MSTWDEFVSHFYSLSAQEQYEEWAKLTPEQAVAFNEAYKAMSLWGPLNPVLFCSHCQTRGHVRTHPVAQKAGISGGKATAAVFTAGISLVATGLSRKQYLTRAHCMNCTSTWHF